MRKCPGGAQEPAKELALGIAHHMPEDSQSERTWDRRKETSDYCRLGYGTARESLNPIGAGRGGQMLHFFFFKFKRYFPTVSVWKIYSLFHKVPTN